jgi:uncharacterized protein
MWPDTAFRVLMVACGTVVAATQVPAQEPLVLPRSFTHVVESRAVGDRFHVLVTLPEGYAGDEANYPVLYVLDAEKSFGLASDVVDWLTWAREIPPVIVVGISYGLGTAEWWQKRSRDLTPTLDSVGPYGRWPVSGGADAFRAALRTEVIPLVEGHYQTHGERMLVGLSFGGLFGAYDLLQEPPLFDHYLLVSPALAWDDELVLELERAHADAGRTLGARVYTAVGSEDRPNILEPWERLDIRLRARGEGTFTYRSEVLAGESHISALPAALARGLKWIFVP